MNYQNPQRKSLGTLYRAEKTKPRSPDMTGQLKIQKHTVREIFEFYKNCDTGEVVCPIAAWINGQPGRHPNLIRIDDTQVRLSLRTRERVRVIHQFEAK